MADVPDPLVAAIEDGDFADEEPVAAAGEVPRSPKACCLVGVDEVLNKELEDNGVGGTKGAPVRPKRPVPALGVIVWAGTPPNMEVVRLPDAGDEAKGGVALIYPNGFGDGVGNKEPGVGAFELGLGDGFGMVATVF